MAQCQWCDKELPNEGANVCSSCVFKSIDELVKPADEDSEDEENRINPDYDLAVLAQEKVSKRKRKGELRSKLYNESMKASPRLVQENPMRKVKVQSKSMRGRTFVVDGDLVLSFDADGFAECDASDVPRIDAFCRVRPGRIWVVKPEAKVVEAEVEEVEEEVETEETKEEAKPRVTKKRAPASKRKKKAAPKKDEEKE